MATNILLTPKRILRNSLLLVLFFTLSLESQTTMWSTGFEPADNTCSYILLTGGTCNRVNSNARTGTWSAKVESASGTGQYDGLIFTGASFTFNPCTLYTINVYAKYVKGPGQLKIFLVDEPAVTQVESARPEETILDLGDTYSADYNVNSTTYSLISVSFSVTSPVTKYIAFRSKIGVGYAGGGVPATYLDDISLTYNTAFSGGTASASSTSLACSGTTTLSLTGQSPAGATIRWQMSPNNVNWYYADATGTPYTTPTLNQTTYYRAEIVGGGCAGGVSNTVTVTVASAAAATWLTTGTTAWGTASNWSTGAVPTACTDVTIPAGGTQPSITAAASCRNLTINSGATLSASSTLSVYGNVLNNGTLNSGAFYVNFEGRLCTWGGTGTYTAGHIRIRNNANYTLTGNPTVATLNADNVATTGSLSLGTYTLTVTSTLYNIFYLHYNSGMVDLRGGGSIDVSKSDYGTGTLWVNSSVNNFGFNLEDNYYNVWFSNSAGATKFGSAAKDVYVKNNLWIKTGSLDLSAAGANSIHVGGDFTNDASSTALVASTATIVMDGVKVQYIGGNFSSTFNVLKIDNGTSSGVSLTQNELVSTSGTLNLVRGPLNLNTKRFTVQNSAATAVTRTSGYVVSEHNNATSTSILQWNMGTTTGAHVYPFGISGSYIPFTFNKTTGGSSNISVSTRRTFSSGTPAGSDNLPLTTGVTTMWSQSLLADGSLPAVIDRWWDILASAAVTADLTFSYVGTENTTTVNPTGSFSAQHWNGSGWDAPVGTGIGVTGAAIGTVTVSAQSTFSPWILSYNLTPLPIELLSFTANGENNRVLTEWTTASEMNNDYFTVERSADGNNFEPVGMVDGAGDNLQGHNYSFSDPDPYRGISYYRLKQTDKDGKFTYSAIEKVEFNNGSDGVFTLHPNPAENSVGIKYSCNTEESAVINILDYRGKLVLQSAVLCGKGINNSSVDLSGLPAGLYFVTLAVEGKVFKSKLIKQCR